MSEGQIHHHRHLGAAPDWLKDLREGDFLEVEPGRWFYIVSVDASEVKQLAVQRHQASLPKPPPPPAPEPEAPANPEPAL